MISDGLEDIVAQFTRLYYSSANEIIYNVAKKLLEKSEAPEIKNQLDSVYLAIASDNLYAAAGYFHDAWELCKPFMSGAEAKKHNKFIKNYERQNARFASDIADMDYKDITKFVKLLADNIKKQADSDREKGRTKLSGLLVNIYLELNFAGDNLRKISATPA